MANEQCIAEEWRPVLGWEQWYAVTADGRVKRTGAAHRAIPGRLLKQHIDKYGYAKVALSRPGTRRPHPRSVHSLVCEAFLGPRPPMLQVNHKNGVRTDNHLTNLEYVTASENKRHAVNVLGTGRGELHGNAKLNDRAALNIRILYAGGYLSSNEIGRLYGVTGTVVRLIGKHKSWKHVRVYDYVKDPRLKTSASTSGLIAP